MSKYLLVFLLIIGGKEAFAQTQNQCYYRLSFHKWKWNDCKIQAPDTVPKYSITTGEHIGDTLVFSDSLEFNPNEGPRMNKNVFKTFIQTGGDLVVSSYNDSIQYMVKSYDIIVYAEQKKVIHIKGTHTGTDQLNMLTGLLQIDSISIGNIQLAIEEEHRLADKQFYIVKD